MHLNSAETQRQRRRFTEASQHYASFTPPQKWLSRLQMKDISYIINHGKSGVKLLQGRQLVISEDVRSLRATGRLTVPPYQICIIMCDEDYNPLAGTLYLKYLEDGTWHDVEGMELDLGNWLFREVPAGKESYRVEGEAVGYIDPKKPENQFMTEDELKQKHWHIMEVPPEWEYYRCTFYPDPHPEVTSCDGETVADHGYYGVIWPEFWSGPAIAAGATDVASAVHISAGYKTDKWRRLARSFILFDTSIILPEHSILSATFRVHGQAKTSTADWPLFSVALVSSWPLSNTDIVIDDHHSLGRTPLSDTLIKYADWKVDDWNEFPLNAAGLAAIAKGGITKLGLREGTYDRANTPPPWAKRVYRFCTFWSADEEEPLSPELTIAWKVPIG